MEFEEYRLNNGKETNTDFVEPSQDYFKRKKNSRTSKLKNSTKDPRNYAPLQANLRSKSKIHIQNVISFKNNKVSPMWLDSDGNSEGPPSLCSNDTYEKNLYSLNSESRNSFSTNENELNSTFSESSYQPLLYNEFNSSLTKGTYSIDDDMSVRHPSAFHIVKPIESNRQSNFSFASTINCTQGKQNLYEYDTESVTSSVSKQYRTVKTVILYKSKSFEKYNSNNCDTKETADHLPSENKYTSVISNLLDQLEKDISELCFESTTKDKTQSEQIINDRSTERENQVESKSTLQKNHSQCKHQNNVTSKVKKNKAKNTDAIKIVQKFANEINKGNRKQLESLYTKLGCALNLNNPTKEVRNVNVTKRRKTSRRTNKVSNYQANSQQSTNSDLKSLYSQCVNEYSSQKSELNDILSSCQPYEFHENIIDLTQAFTNTVEFLSSIRMEQVILTKTINLTTYVNSQTIKDNPHKVSVTITRNKEMFKQQDKLYLSLCNLLKNDLLVYSGDNVVNSTDKWAILEKIQGIFRDLHEKQEANEKLVITYRNNTNWNNVIFHNDRLLLKPLKEAKLTSVIYSRQQSTQKFRLLLYLLRKIYNLIMLDATSTKREIYYQIINYVRKQEQVNDALTCVSIVLDVPTWKLGVFSTSRGLVYGNLFMEFTDFQLDCKVKGGLLIPQNLSHLRRVESGAYFILIVEKDSIFQKLIDEENKSYFSGKYILITGKGYPDTNTRLFVKTLWKLLRIPAFILVDSDPYGIEIMLCYKYGSLKASHLSNELALPNLRWIGIWPSEIGVLNVTHQPLTNSDLKKINFMLSRPYLKENSLIRRELEILLIKKQKAEIEGVIKSNNYLSNFYLFNKFKTSDFI